MKLYPFKSNFLELDSIKYHYVDEGSGEVIIMLHGNPTWSFYYRNLIGSLKGSYRVIAPDHIGCGLSDKPDDSKYQYTLQRRVEDLENLIKYLNIEDKITLVVHDWGGMIGMVYASRYPNKIKRFVVMNTSCSHLPETKKLPFPLWLCRNTPLGGFMVRGLNAFSLGASLFCCKRKPMEKEIKEGYLSPYDSWENRIAVLRFVQDIPLKPEDPGYDLVSKVEESIYKFQEIPMLICWGDKDFVFDKHFLREWVKRFPKAQVHNFSDAGHYVLEDASEEIIPIIKEFLNN